MMDPTFVNIFRLGDTLHLVGLEVEGRSLKNFTALLARRVESGERKESREG